MSVDRTTPGWNVRMTPAPFSPFGDNANIAQLIGRRAETRKDREFLVWVPNGEPVQRWSYAAFAHDVFALAAGLRRAGIAPGERVALVMDNRPEFLIAWSAITSIGAVAVCLNTRSSSDELAYFAEHSAIVAAFADAEHVEPVGRVMPALRWLCAVDEPATFRRYLADPDEILVPTPSSAPASIQYTSGTTARPKAVVWTQANCLWGGLVNSRHQDLTISDVNFVHLPLFHTNALSYSFLATLWTGSSMVLVPRFSVSRFWRVAVEHRCTWSTLVAFCLRALASVEAPDEHYFRGWAGGSVTAVGTGPGGVGTTGWFGMTETISHPICSLPGLPGVVGSMGRPAPEYGVAVVDDDDRPVPTGEAGNLLVLGTRGLSLFVGYHDNPEAAAKAFTDTGWFRTGDRVRAGEDGSIMFVERDKDVLKVGGENIGAPEIERVVLGTPGVREAAVVGRPHPMLGEVPVVFVTVSGDPAEAETAIRQRCEGMLADFKRPREVFVIDDFPRSTLDKIAKAALRARVADSNPT